MLIVMRHDATDEQVARIIEAVRAHGFNPKPVPGAERTAICVLGNRGPIDAALFEGQPGVLECIPVTKPYKLVSRDTRDENTVVEVNGVRIGGGHPLALIAGPCSVESRDQIFRAAEALAQRGVRLLRGGAFKPRTSPYAFQGMGDEALDLLA